MTRCAEEDAKTGNKRSKRSRRPNKRRRWLTKPQGPAFAIGLDHPDPATAHRTVSGVAHTKTGRQAEVTTPFGLGAEVRRGRAGKILPSATAWIRRLANTGTGKAVCRTCVQDPEASATWLL